jgi:ABC-type dipeptide/oligopeptide/nickel transport system permease subunit
VLVYAALTIPMAIRQEALLSFLGLGVEPPHASLGSLLREGLGSLSALGAEWWLLVFPAALLVVLSGALNTFADWLRDRLDPRARARASR